VATYDAILPAGGTVDADLGQRVGTGSKALIEFNARTILDRTFDALEASGRVERTVLIGTDEVLASAPAKRASRTLKAERSAPGNILMGLKSLLADANPPQKVLIVTTDLPFLTGKIITDFLDKCPTDRDICVPLVTRTEYTARFPGATATFVPLRDNTWTTGCAYVMDVQAFQAALPHLERLFINRKNKVGMVRQLGLRFLIKFLFKTLTVPDVEAKIESMLGCSGAAILHSPPELAYDIDDLEDFNYAMEHLDVLDRR
jgi:GTP:adenosylcobinamide-phosphate guanylyltransferase